MNRSDLVNELKDKATLSKKDATEVIDIFFDKIASTRLNSSHVALSRMPSSA